VDIDPGVLGKNYPALLGVVSDGAGFVSGLLPRLTAKIADSELRRSISAGHAEVWSEWEPSAKSERVSPPLLIRTLQSVLGPDAIFTTDSGNGTFLAMECLRLERPRSFLAPIDYSCMGYAMPSAVGAALACPDRPVAALAGDGAFLMTGLELLTASSNKLPVMVLVLRDRELAQISQFQQTAMGKKACSELPDYDLSAICRGVEVQHLALRHNSEIEDVLNKARAITQTGKPVVVEVEIDYSEKTYFTRGVVRTNFGRLPWRDRLRLLLRAVTRRLG
jgi:acetolactate synthase-1/2/3 large subunit